MRVVFFAQGARVPAARVRAMAIAVALREAGISCSVRMARPSVYGDNELPAPLNRARGLYAPLAAISRAGQLRDLGSDDIVFFQRPMLEFPVLFFERWAARGRRSIFDFDDAIFDTWATRGKFRQLIGLVDRVIAGNRYLAAAAAAPEKTTIIPTVVDTDRWRVYPARLGRGADVTVGWTGLGGNYPHLAYAAPGIARALRRTGARFLIISDRPPPRALAALNAEFVPWRADTEVEDLARIDIGVMPLPDAPYERGKCAFKLIQHMALGRPGIASPVGANIDVVTPGQDGFLPTDDDAWDEAVGKLVDDPVLRAEMGARARRRVEADYSLRAVIPLYLAIIRDLSR